MKLAMLIGERFKEKPMESTVDSHALMLRGGYMKNVANGIYASYLPLKRVTRKIEQIIREEMDALDGQEVSLPVVLPASYWQMSNRYTSVGSELLRFEDRHHTPYVLAMTHEEAAVMLVKDYAQSYTKYPLMIYQFQTKFRDEARPRAGLIRVREFTMKDAYSFHLTQEDLEAYYQRCLEAYHRIFERVGLPEVISVASDSGMMGGNISHEFMLLNEIGEDSIAVCPHCGYHANVEAAYHDVQNEIKERKDLELIATPNIKTMEDLVKALAVDLKQVIKAVVYQKKATNDAIVIFIRGDLEVNESKLTRHLGFEIELANNQTLSENHLCAGFVGPYRLDTKATVLYDNSLKHLENCVCGANQIDKHYQGLSVVRDLQITDCFDFSKIKEGAICPACRQNGIQIQKGIEVGNIFQLGDKYTKSMGMTYVDQNGVQHYPLMGCYGIGIGRLAASLVEARHDQYGPIWPMAIAPWQVHICALRSDALEVKQVADKLYSDLKQRHLEVIYDDRHVSAGAMFSDADLLGVPIRVIVSPRNLKKQILEIKMRDGSLHQEVPLDEVLEFIEKLVKEAQ